MRPGSSCYCSTSDDTSPFDNPYQCHLRHADRFAARTASSVRLQTLTIRADSSGFSCFVVRSLQELGLYRQVGVHKHKAGSILSSQISSRTWHPEVSCSDRTPVPRPQPVRSLLWQSEARRIPARSDRRSIVEKTSAEPIGQLEWWFMFSRSLITNPP